MDLSGADLSDVNLTGMDLSEVNLSNADLSGANLLNAKVEANNWEYLDAQQKEEAFHTIKGSSNSETITGTSFKDFIEAKMGSNFINGKEGEDIIVLSGNEIFASSSPIYKFKRLDLVYIRKFFV